MMKEYDIINLEDSKMLLIIIRTCESPFDYLSEITADLQNINYSGKIIFDELLHSGNNDERFISCFFDHEFQTESFQFMTVKKQSPLRSFLCEYLQKEKDYLPFSGLTSYQQKLIEKNCVI
ncbi:MAG: type II toxin-antitoxin system RnlB family antitoxin [Lachnospiraceae bacterium]|nr:type II toxin-antitoxin system RnlB family antitoxin [Lachnospiraceae bacterium]